MLCLTKQEYNFGLCVDHWHFCFTFYVVLYVIYNMAHVLSSQLMHPTSLFRLSTHFTWANAYTQWSNIEQELDDDVLTGAFLQCAFWSQTKMQDMRVVVREGWIECTFITEKDCHISTYWGKHFQNYSSTHLLALLRWRNLKIIAFTLFPFLVIHSLFCLWWTVIYLDSLYCKMPWPSFLANCFNALKIFLN